MAKKKLTFVFIDDDKDTADQWLRWAEEKGYTAYHAESALEANRIRSDFYVFDISVVAPSVTLYYTAYSAIATLAENHPGATIVIVTGLAGPCVEDVIEDVYEVCGVRPIYGGWGKYEDFEKALGDYL